MFICEIVLFDWYFPQNCTSDMSKYGYLEVFQRVPSTSRLRESTLYELATHKNKNVSLYCVWYHCKGEMYSFHYIHNICQHAAAARIRNVSTTLVLQK